MIACASGGSAADCLNARQVAAIKRLMTPATNSKGEVLYAYPYIPGTETQWAGWNYLGTAIPGYPPSAAGSLALARFANMVLSAIIVYAPIQTLSDDDASGMRLCR